MPATVILPGKLINGYGAIAAQADFDPSFGGLGAENNQPHAVNLLPQAGKAIQFGRPDSVIF